MSNQVFKNQTTKYDNANTSSAIWTLTANVLVPTNTPTGVAGWVLNLDQGLVSTSEVGYTSGITWTFNKAGVYMFQMNAIWATGLGYRINQFSFFESSSGTTRILSRNQDYVDPNAIHSDTTICIVKASAGSTITPQVEQTSGAGLNIIGSGSDVPPGRSNIVITRIA